MFRMKIIRNWTLASLILCSLLQVIHAGCKYTNPQWVVDDQTFLTAPRIYLTFNGVNEDDQVWLSANWNLSLVDKYRQCIDDIQVLVKKIKDPKTKKTVLCDLQKSTAHNCSGHLSRKDFCDETLDIWVRVTNRDYKDGLQPIGAPSMTRIDNFHCGEPYTTDALGTFVPSQSCESLQPAWNGAPSFGVPDGSRGKRFVNISWTNSLIQNVICVDEIEIKYWEEGALSKGYQKESVKTTNTGSEDYEYQMELDVTVCKTYSYMIKAMKNEPYYVTTFEGKFSSKCDENMLQMLSTTTTVKAPKPKKTTTTTSEPESTETESKTEEASTAQMAEKAEEEKSSTNEEKVEEETADSNKKEEKDEKSTIEKDTVEEKSMQKEDEEVKTEEKTEGGDEEKTQPKEGGGEKTEDKIETKEGEEEKNEDKTETKEGEEEQSKTDTEEKEMEEVKSDAKDEKEEENETTMIEKAETMSTSADIKEESESESSSISSETTANEKDASEKESETTLASSETTKSDHDDTESTKSDMSHTETTKSGDSESETTKMETESTTKKDLNELEETDRTNANESASEKVPKDILTFLSSAKNTPGSQEEIVNTSIITFSSTEQLLSNESDLIANSMNNSDTKEDHSEGDSKTTESTNSTESENESSTSEMKHTHTTEEMTENTSTTTKSGEDGDTHTTTGLKSTTREDNGLSENATDSTHLMEHDDHRSSNETENEETSRSSSNLSMAKLKSNNSSEESHNDSSEMKGDNTDGDFAKRVENVNLIKRGRVLLGEASEESDSSQRDNARALQLNPWGRSQAIKLSTSWSSFLVTTLILTAFHFN